MYIGISQIFLDIYCINFSPTVVYWKKEISLHYKKKQYRAVWEGFSLNMSKYLISNDKLVAFSTISQGILFPKGEEIKWSILLL
jgi:hypothetical protein